jgi:hypothetical protein
MTPDELQKLIRLNKGIVDDKPYVPGQKNIPEENFNRKLVPLCLQCKTVTVDFWIYQGTVDLEHFCDENCEAKHQLRRQRQQEQESRERVERLRAGGFRVD